ncbi:MAG: hypothetical protein CVU65_11525 [Deltaproteobacteria bacterium HGW-Deltaproteobacteria-22]|nr:MAG: hypothetical protein CVU65_11525 [Deltaproteobacteria bacterium HGW-Deltaproteobacteria-22]
MGSCLLPAFDERNAMNQIETIRTEEIQKRRDRGRAGAFEIRNDRGDHPFFQRYRVRSETFFPYFVEIHALFSDESNTCTCRDRRTSELGTCKHIEAVLYKLQQENQTAFQWTLQKQPYLEDAVFAHEYEGRPCLRVRLSTEARASGPRLADDFGARIDGETCRVFSPPQFDRFIKKAQENKFVVLESARRLVQNLKREPQCLIGDPQLLEFPAPQSWLAKPLKPQQVESVRHLLSYPSAVIAEPAGTGKRVSALAAAAQIRRLEPVSPVVIITDPVWMAHWKRLIQVFDPGTVYQFGEPKGRAEVSFEERYQYYIANVHTLARDARWIQRIRPQVLILDEFWMLHNWHGPIGSLIKTVSAPHTFWLSSAPVVDNPDLMLQLAQCMVPEQLGPLWQFRSTHGVTSANGAWEIGDDLAVLRSWLEPRIQARPPEKCQALRRPKLRVIASPTRAQARLANEELSKLVALAATNFTWGTREISQVVEKIHQLRLGMSVPAFLGLEREANSIKLAALVQLVSMEVSCGRRVVVFTHWQELGSFVQEQVRRAGVRVRLLHTPKDAAELDSEKYPVALVSDEFLDFKIPDVDVVMNIDLPWETSLYAARKAVCDIPDSRHMVEYNFVVNNSVEDRGLIVLESLPHLVAGIDERTLDPSKIDPQNLRNLIRKLAGRREERLSSSQSQIKVDRVSQRERKVISRKGLHEIERPMSRGRTMVSSAQLDRSSTPSTQLKRRGRLYVEGESLAEFENTAVLLHLEVVSTGGRHEAVFASIIEPRSRRYLGWISRQFGELGRLLAKNPVVVGSCSVGRFSELFASAFGAMAAEIPIVDLQSIVEGIAREDVDIRNLLEATCGRKVVWDAAEVNRLMGNERWADLLELGHSELRMVWELLTYMVRESRFYCKVNNERQVYPLEVSEAFPEVLGEFLNRHPSI